MADAAPRTDPSAPAVILSPHLDDAVWSCFSELSIPRTLAPRRASHADT